jgi:hypothetical protein
MELVYLFAYLVVAYMAFKLYNWSFRRWIGEKPYLKDLPLPTMLNFTLILGALISPTVLMWLLHVLIRGLT